MQVLPLMPETVIKTVNNYISNFIWNGRKAKIGLKTLQLDKENGGATLVDLWERDKAMKISWTHTKRR